MRPGWQSRYPSFRSKTARPFGPQRDPSRESHVDRLQQALVVLGQPTTESDTLPRTQAYTPQPARAARELDASGVRARYIHPPTPFFSEVLPS